jgi:hypothetical protein
LAIIRQKHKYIIGKVCYGRGMCRFAAQLSVRCDVNSVAEEGRLLDKNGIQSVGAVLVVTLLCVMKTNFRHYLSSVYFVHQPLHVSGIFVVYHQ